jgi:lantibiotic modifying enzyme
MSPDADTLKFLETRAALFSEIAAHMRELTTLFHHHSPVNHKELHWAKCDNHMCQRTVELLAKAAHGLGD